MGTASPWWDEQADIGTPGDQLRPGLRTGVCVIGAGMAGLSVAYALARDGVDVVVIDAGPVGGGETGRTTAHLASAVDDHFFRLERLHGGKGAQLAYASHAGAIDAIERNVRELGIECDFQRVNGYLFGDPNVLELELAAARRAEAVVEPLERAPLLHDTGPALRFANQGRFHPIRYLRGLARAFLSLGGRIYTGARAVEVDGARVVLEGDRVIDAGDVVDATDAAVTYRVGMSLRQGAYRSYAMAFTLADGLIPDALYWDTDDPYHYIRLAPGNQLIVGGEDHKTGQVEEPARRWARLEEWTRKRFGPAGNVTARWSGQIMEPADALAFIGRSAKDEHQYVATGDSGQGMTHGALAGILIPDLILGRENPWQQLYDPRRSSLRAVGRLVTEAANASAQYADWLRRGDVSSLDEIRPGTGAIVRRGLKMVAVYRDPDGVCHERSATCPHLGGVVGWNDAEKSWDCPCHGSRFDPFGRVLNGPAVSGLGES
jgi:glycine/D-amino acid oxidase-like deaminating enzyme/nitrite reductase/ring-hydroxylating ferredoxin subunit